MKNINVIFEDKEMEQLELKKGKLSWHDFILTLSTRLKESK